MRDKNVPMRLKTFNECMLPVMTYGCDHNPREDGENYGRSYPQGQKEYNLDSEIEWCDRHYQEHKRK